MTRSLLSTAALTVALAIGLGAAAGERPLPPPPIIPTTPPPPPPPDEPATPFASPTAGAISQLASAAAADGAYAGEVSPEGTARITRSIAVATSFCARIESDLYRIDCLSDRLDSLADELPSSGDYADTRAAVEEAAAGLAQVARRYRARSVQPARVREAVPGGAMSSRPLVPVRAADLAQANAEATAVLDRVEGILLRSAEASARRRVHFEQVATAFEGSKVLLRSA